jgi:hypothetical protein
MRNVVQRRLASTENSFIKERQAVKEHAASSTGTLDGHLGLSREIEWSVTLTRLVDLWRKISL